jgi:DNA-binding protein HU-beta
MSSRITKTDLVGTLATKAEISKAEAKRVLDAMLGVISGALADGNKVTLTGFGTFEVRNVKARTGVNPRTKERIQIPATKRPVFKAGAVLKRSVSGD